MRLSETDQKKWRRAVEDAQAVSTRQLRRPSLCEPEGVAALSQPQRRLLPTEASEIAEAYHSGMSIRQLAARWTISREGVRTALANAGVETRKPTTFTDSELATMANLFASGWSLNRLGRKYGVDPKTVRARLQATAGT